ncbi:MAG: IS200/IS605 family element transposase accessory protein TnpB [Gemmatimonadetes bacterium]|nr:IS200/IS605 family element transposase accessory protein TnpB [Gemmatimonadota bacterium]MYK40194.1 IS200/IS605 family element transposase accessory protein TnpB [Gemmatimonadota bacterium]
MKRIIQVKLLPTAEQAGALEKTMRRFNAACNWVAERAFERQLANSYALHKLYYYEVREKFALPADIAILTFAQVAANYKRDKSKRVLFRPLAAIPYRKGAFRYKGLEMLNIKTADGQRHDIPMVMGDYQAEQFGNVKLFAELVRRKDGQWFLMATVEFDAEPPCDPNDFLGVDLGVENLAVDSDGQQHSGQDVERVRVKCQTLKQALQSAADLAKNHRRRKRIRKKLKRIGDREARFRRNTNHCISKQLVAKAKDTTGGIALEDLKGIRKRIRFRKPQRVRIAGWGFDQLRQFIAYKAQQAGVKLMLVDPKHTSQMCSQCGHIERANRSSQSKFRCKQCGYQAHADYNAARNIRARALVNAPIVSAHSVAAG